MCRYPLNMTRHFRERWQERTGKMPVIEDIRRLIDEGILVNDGGIYYDFAGQQIVFLKIVWSPERDVIFKIDELQKKIVTVLSKNMGGNNGENRKYR